MRSTPEIKKEMDRALRVLADADYSERPALEAWLGSLRKELRAAHEAELCNTK